MSDVDDRRDRIQQVWEAAWDRGEVDDLDKLLSPDYLRFGTSSAGQGLADFKGSIVTTRAAFPDLLTVVDEIVIEGDRAAIRWHSTGTHQHPFMGVPATQRTVSISGATFSRFDGDHVVEEFVTWDPRALLTALGIISVGQDQ
jgi:steroid delta-isomerase-like uncharacterized protein